MAQLAAPRAVPTSRLCLAALIFGGMLGGLYWGVLRSLVSQWWEDPNYSHGFLVPLFSGFLIWQRRRDLQVLTPRGSWLGFVVLIGGVGALILGEVGAENFLTRSSLIVIVAGLVLFHVGPDAFRVLLFPLAFLSFMVPLPATVLSSVTFPLQSLAAQNAVWTLDLLGIPVLRDGNVIHLSEITLGVTEACSGIRSLMSLLALAIAWAYLALPGFWPMLTLAASVIPNTVIANAGRIVATGLIGRSFGAEYAQGVFHTLSGWIIFLFAFMGLVGVHGLIRFAGQIRRRRGT